MELRGSASTRLSAAPGLPKGAFHVFCSHDWRAAAHVPLMSHSSLCSSPRACAAGDALRRRGNEDELGRDNHATVSRINEGLKARGLVTWCGCGSLGRADYLKAAGAVRTGD